MAFPPLIIELSKFLPYDSIKTICKDYKNYKEMKISQAQFKRYIKSTAGDKLLAAILRSRNQSYAGTSRMNQDDWCIMGIEASMLEGQQEVIRWLCHAKI